MPRYDRQFRERVRDTYILSHASGNGLTLEQVADMHNVPPSTIRKWSGEERWSDDARLAGVSCPELARGARIMQPVVAQSTKEYLTEQRIGDMVDAQVQDSIDDALERKLRPVMETLVEQQALIANMREEGRRLMNIGLNAIPDNLHELLEAGFSPKQLIELIKVGSSIVAGTFKQERDLYEPIGNGPGGGKRGRPLPTVNVTVNNQSNLIEDVSLSNRVESLHVALQRLGVSPDEDEYIDAEFGEPVAKVEDPPQITQIEGDDF